MLIALDYDETYTRDPEFWNQFIALVKAHGHSVICATMRYEHEGDEVRRDLAHRVEAIVFTGRKAKHGAVHRAGFMPSIWIDDCPAFILQDARS